MFGLGRQKLPAAKAAELFVKFATDNALKQFYHWENSVGTSLKMLSRDPAPFHAAIGSNPDSVILFLGCYMAGSLSAPRNLFAADVAQAVYSNVHHELCKSSFKWLAPFVFDLIQENQNQPGTRFIAYALIKELGVGDRSQDLERFMLGPIFLLKLNELALESPTMTFWKALSEESKIVM